MSTIRDTVAQSLRESGRGSYLSEAQPVIDSLEGREERIKEGLRRYATGRGLSGRDVDTLFVEVGLTEPNRSEFTPGGPVPASGGAQQAPSSDVNARLDEIGREIRALKEAARRHGVHV